MHYFAFLTLNSICNFCDQVTNLCTSLLDVALAVPGAYKSYKIHIELELPYGRLRLYCGLCQRATDQGWKNYFFKDF